MKYRFHLTGLGVELPKSDQFRHSINQGQIQMVITKASVFKFLNSTDKLSRRKIQIEIFVFVNKEKGKNISLTTSWKLGQEGSNYSGVRETTNLT